MSSINVNTIKSRLGGPPTLPSGVVVSAAATFNNDVSIGGTLTYEDVTNVDAVGLITARNGIKFGVAGVGGTIRANGDTTLAGVVTATSFSGAATGLTGVPGGQITGALAAVDGSALTGIPALTGSTNNTIVTVTGSNAIAGEANFTFNGSGDLTVKGNEGTSANLYLIADEGDDNGDGWRVGSNQDSNDLTIANNSSGSYVDKITLLTDKCTVGTDVAVTGFTTFSGNVTLSRAAGPTLELVTNANTANSSLHLSEGTAGATTNGGAVIYSGANNKLSICCGTTLTTERIGIARDSGDVTIGTGVTISAAGICTITTGTDLNGYKVESGDVSGGTLNGEFDFELQKGHIKRVTGATGGNYFPDFKVSSSVSLNSIMDVGDTITATLIVASSSHYCTTGIKIDNSTSNIDLDWVGGSAPSAANGSGVDIYGFTIIKTAATPAYHIIGNAMGAA